MLLQLAPPRSLKAFISCFIAVATMLATGCDSIGYYQQVVSGQLQLLQQRQNIEKLLQSADLAASTRNRLQLVQQLRRFAATDLALPVDERYDSYVELGREFVVWNVFAAPVDSLQLQQWCFPVAGCVSYRGYFAEVDAVQESERLRAQGLETWVGGVTAYSTLGWFDDPVLSSMLRRDNGQLAGLLFHELAHQRVYVKGDTTFNESFATVVEQEGQQRWLQQLPAPEQRTLAADIELARGRQQQFVALVQEAVAGLTVLYAESLPESVRQSRKLAIHQELRAGYAALKQQWHGYSGYEQWFGGPLNNAQLATVTTYNQWVPALRTLLARCEGSLVRFYREVEALAAMSAAERLRMLTELSAAA